MSDINQYDAEKTIETSDAFPEWENNPSLSVLKGDLEKASRIHKTHMESVAKWRDLLKAAPLPKSDKKEQKNSRVQPKLVRKQAEWRYPSLSEPFLNNDKIISVTPVTWEDRDRQQQVSLLLNYQWETCVDRVSFIDKYVRKLVDEGTAILRTGWDYQERTVEKDLPVYQLNIDPSMRELLLTLNELKNDSPAEYSYQVDDGLKAAHDYFMQTGLPVRPTIIEYERREVVEVIRDQPTVELCDIDHVIIDPSCKGDIDKAKFFVHEYTTCLADLQAQGVYHNLDQIDLTTVTDEVESATGIETPDFNFTDDARKQFTVYEYWGYWDINGDDDLRPVVITWVGNTVIRKEESPYPGDGLPFIVVPYLPLDDIVYGEADGELLEDNQKITGAVTRGMIDLMAKSANSQTGTRRGSLDPTNLRKFRNGEDYEFSAQNDPRMTIHTHQFPEIPQSAPLMLQYQASEAESITGVKSFSQGINGNSYGDVATGVRGAMDAASKREVAILRRLVNGIVKVCRNWLAMDAEFLDEQQVVRITNDDFVQIDKDDVAGQFDIRLDISTAEEDNAKAGELAFMLQTIGNNAPPDMTKMILGEICRLRRMPDLAKQIEEYQPQPDPIQQMEQMENLRQLQMQNLLLQAQAAEKFADTDLNVAKTAKTYADAGKVQSEKDLHDLTFLEQESGVTQARNMQLQTAQARANMELETHKAQLQERSDARERLREYYSKQ